MIKSIALIFALAIALAPAAALAQSSGGYLTPSAPRAAVHHHVRKAPAEARLARPTFGQPQRENLPAISRNPDDCVKTMCTCLAGGGC